MEHATMRIKYGELIYCLCGFGAGRKAFSIRDASGSAIEQAKCALSA
jgi:hypothetical protein